MRYWTRNIFGFLEFCILKCFSYIQLCRFHPSPRLDMIFWEKNLLYLKKKYIISGKSFAHHISILKDTHFDHKTLTFPLCQPHPSPPKTQSLKKKSGANKVKYCRYGLFFTFEFCLALFVKLDKHFGVASWLFSSISF